MHSQTQNTLPNTPKNANNKAGLAIINSKAPYSSHFGKDALDVALIFGSYEQKVSLFFQGDGVYQLIAKQDTSLLSIKDYLKTFAAFEFYDIEHIYACQQSLLNRKLEPSFHITDVQILSVTEFSAALNQHQYVLRF